MSLHLLSYNPPTKAHMNIILSSFQVNTQGGLACWSAASNCWTISKAPLEPQGPPKFSRILLLLATNNADKGLSTPIFFVNHSLDPQA